jgi:hypothetical protein
MSIAIAGVGRKLAPNGGADMADKIQKLRAKLVDLRRQRADELDAAGAEDFDKLARLALVHVAIEALDAVAKEGTPKIDPEAMMPKL